MNTTPNRSFSQARLSDLLVAWNRHEDLRRDGASIAESRDVGTIRVRDADGADVPHDVLFAFAFHAFWPDGTWMLD